ncbi:MAG: DNA alkylation repair protein [Acidobacteriota bacterium]|nr:DNA alkylation repair protein [Acidobacteriota bacterium]
MSGADLKRELRAAGTPERAVGAMRYFKTGKGDYGEGDVFLGVTAPDVHKIVRRYETLNLDDVEKLLGAKEHEVRSAALLVLVAQYKKGDDTARKQVFDLYLRNTQHINNWDLVDCSCGEIVGAHLLTRSRTLLTKLAKSKSLWERRIAMISTMRLVREGDLTDALRIAEILLDDGHDLIHKAVGWVMRVVGDMDRAALLGFLEKNYARMPRTALRYAIEHFPPEERKKMLAGEFGAA